MVSEIIRRCGDSTTVHSDRGRSRWMRRPVLGSRTFLVRFQIATPRYRSLWSIPGIAEGAQDGWRWPRYGADDVTPSAFNLVDPAIEVCRGKQLHVQFHGVTSRSNAPRTKKDYDLVVQERGEAPGPYKIFIQNPNLLQVLIPVGKYFQRSHSSLSDAEREIVVNLINAKWRAAYSNYEHEMIGERAGLPPEKVQALISGLHTSLNDPRQQVVYNHWNFLCSQPRPRSAATSGGMRGSKFRSDCDAPRNTARFSSRRIGDSF